MTALPSLPRFPLANLPTPLDKAPRLSQELGIYVLIKRDDLTGFALGGNKARVLEFLLADALEKNADMIITGGGPQSNHARITAAAARKAKLDAALVLFGEPPPDTNGNLLLDEILGAEIIYTHTEDRSQTEPTMQRVAEDYRARGRRPYIIPRGGSTALGSIAYLFAVQELLEQLHARQIQPNGILLATGSGGTHAGILAGMKYFRAAISVYGIAVSRPVAESAQRIHALIQEMADCFQLPLSITPDDIWLDDAYLGAGYGIITKQARRAIERVAQLEGIFLDPVYTGKAMAGLIDLVQRGVIARGSTVVF
ncbi:MAG TPA: D-cysteine desulfhydrase family protein [Anaerolineae bacterium]|nr:D-cysteine desulfhydrase family protein [Anaerolineae bacterium]